MCVRSTRRAPNIRRSVSNFPHDLRDLRKCQQRAPIHRYGAEMRAHAVTVNARDLFIKAGEFQRELHAVPHFYQKICFPLSRFGNFKPVIRGHGNTIISPVIVWDLLSYDRPEKFLRQDYFHIQKLS